ncbi:LOW QUALITY PROTEIN: opioid growth factor receptor [Xenopus tropicalis]|uniref:LOW QUALITY PROTEIN: opioid growth factor receptor n=1 Tax=Xenopus tropicalis TaxID=8364 RepID=A0A8J0QU99_XENTR|nr:LOW QUALITY PROTEIN: opioid growth factor receptor [Xenopus tropicalis]
MQRMGGATIGLFRQIETRFHSNSGLRDDLTSPRFPVRLRYFRPLSVSVPDTGGKWAAPRTLTRPVALGTLLPCLAFPRFWLPSDSGNMSCEWEERWEREYDSTWEGEEQFRSDCPEREARRGACRSARAARDMQNYRHGYPGKEEQDSKEMPNLQFYQNQNPFQPNGEYIDTMLSDWRGDYVQLEENHSYIQWLFPLRERGMNWCAEPLTLREIEALKGDKDAMRRFREAYRLMLDFYGIELRDEDSGEVARAPNYKERFSNLNRRGHNNLRITRILKCLGELGYGRFQAPLVRFFLEETLVHKELPNVRHSALDYFMFTVRDREQRKELVLFAWEHFPDKGRFIWGPRSYLRNRAAKAPQSRENSETPDEGEGNCGNSGRGSVNEGQKGIVKGENAAEGNSREDLHRAGGAESKNTKGAGSSVGDYTGEELQGDTGTQGSAEGEGTWGEFQGKGFVGKEPKGGKLNGTGGREAGSADIQEGMGEGAKDTGRPGSAEGRDTGGDVEGKGSLGGEETYRGKLDSTETGRPEGADKEDLGENVREGEDTGRPGSAEGGDTGGDVKGKGSLGGEETDRVKLDSTETGRPGGANKQGLGENVREGENPGKPVSSDKEENTREEEKETGRPGSAKKGDTGGELGEEKLLGTGKGSEGAGDSLEMHGGDSGVSVSEGAGDSGVSVSEGEGAVQAVGTDSAGEPHHTGKKGGKRETDCSLNDPKRMKMNEPHNIDLLINMRNCNINPKGGSSGNTGQDCQLQRNMGNDLSNDQGS